MWTFIQDQILGMKWLNALIEQLLLMVGLNVDSRIGGTLIEHLHMEDQIADFIRNNNSKVDIESPNLTVKDRLIYSGDQVVSTFKKVFPYILVGIPMYADIFGTIPIAEALLAKGALLGTIISFMMAVTTLSLPSLIMLKKAIKPKLLATFVAICTVGIIIVGYGFNAIAYLPV